ncbi:MAG: hypothetical protein Q9217_003637 [Psora testacea]
MAPDLAVPAPPNLVRTRILEAMIDHISDLQSQHPEVKVDVLKSNVLRPAAQKHLNQEVQLRGFLQAFFEAPAFQERYKVLDPHTKEQVNRFKNDTSAHEVLRDSDFNILGAKANISTVASVPTGQRNVLSQLTDFFLRAFVKVAKPLVLFLMKRDQNRAVARLQKAQHTVYAGGPKLFDGGPEAKPIIVYRRMPFQNWGLSVANVPQYTFVPTTVIGIQNIVLYAKQNNLRVRCGGYRHSWSSSFSNDREILISLLPIVHVTQIPDPMSIQPANRADRKTELSDITLLPPNSQNPKKRLCRIGVSVTNEEFRLWAVTNKEWTLPADVILVEVTIGGVNAPICHGAGARHKTISDYVRAVEYVDAHGVCQKVDDPDLLRVAAGCFGLLGIVTHITFELDAMTYAILKPQKKPAAFAIPPPDNDIRRIPDALWDVKKYGEKDEPNAEFKQNLKLAKEDFDNRAANDYYSEWFWFTYQKRVWVNTWNNTTDATDVVDYPDAAETFLQWLQGWLGGIITDTYFFREMPGAWQAQLLATMGMAVLPPTNGEDEPFEVKTWLPNALHFRRGVQNMRVRDMELQIPIPRVTDGSDRHDFSVVQKAWWDCIDLVYSTATEHESPSVPSFLNKTASHLSRRSPASHKRTPMRLTLELRIMGGSDIHMAAQFGNELTASIEILTIPDSEYDGEWESFMQSMCDKWMSYTDNHGARLNVRPHWAKEWEGLEMLTGKGQERLEARQYLRSVSYKEKISDFKKTMARIGETQGWDLDSAKARFSNPLWDTIIYG